MLALSYARAKASRVAPTSPFGASREPVRINNTMKRKRKSHREQREAKRKQTADHATSDRPTWPLLRYYYPVVSTLRQYLASRLSQTSKKRCRGLLRYGTSRNGDLDGEVDQALLKLLDGTVVGSSHLSKVNDGDDIEKDLTVFTQQVSDLSITISSTQGALKQSEVNATTPSYRPCFSPQ